MQKRISELKDHYVVCGLGTTGRHAVEELQKMGTPFVVIETHEENIQKLREHLDASHLLYIIGDATDDDVLTQAGIARARGLIVALSADKDNLVIIVMVRQMNPKIRIVARCTDPKFSEKMLKAGANSTVSPNHIGGLRMARRIFAAPALQRFVREESLPGSQVQSDDELLDYARRNGNTCYHAS